MIQAPIIPRSKDDPTGQDKYADQADRRFKKIMRNIREKFEEKLRGIKRYSITPNGLLVNVQYIYQLNEAELNMMMDELTQYVHQQLEFGEKDNWFYKDYVEPAYQRGTAIEYTSLNQQSSIFATQSLGSRMLTESYAKRIALVKYRVFEEMQNLTAKVKADMTLILSDGIAQGMSISKITEGLRHMEGVDYRRAKMIARTEILTAYRRARLEEAEQARIDYGLQTKMLWISALSPTSREWHVSRHGKTYTEQEVKDFYTRDANAINCKCTQVSVLVDSNGDIINDVLSKRLIKMREVASEYNAQLSDAG